MRWTQLRSVVESLFAPSVAGRLRIHATGYGHSTWGRSWLTWDGEEIANLSDDDAYNRRGASMYDEPCVIPASARTQGRLVEPGEFSSKEFKNACYRFKDMSVGTAVASGEPLLVALATAHRKLGRPRVAELSAGGQHPLVRRIAQLRLAAESRANFPLQRSGARRARPGR